MFTRLGRFVVRRRRRVLWSTLAAVVVAAVVGSGVFGVLKDGGFEHPGSESTRAADELAERFGTGDPNLVVLATADGGDVDAPEAAADGLALTQELAAIEGVGDVVSYWSLGGLPALASEGGDKALVLARIEGDDDAVGERYQEISTALGDRHGTLALARAGQVATFDEVGHTVEGDLARAESIAVPITLVLLVFVFGSVVAASLPLMVGAVSVVGTFLVLYVLGSITDVSIFSINLTTALGLGLAIDYSLFVVSRFREELRKGRDVETAVVRTVESAGRTVAFSALTVAVSLSALVIFPLYFLRSFAYAGVAVVLVAMVASIVVLPAALAALGPRVDAWRIVKRPPPEEGTGFWHRMASWVMRRPIGVASAVVVLLVFLGLPFLGATFGLPDDRVLPPGSDVRRTAEVLRQEFTSDEGQAFGIVVPAVVTDGDLDAYAAAVSSVEGVGRVDSRTGSWVDGAQVAPATPLSARFAGGDAGTWLNVVPDVEPTSPQGEALVHDLRALDTPFDTLVGGQAAQLVDTKAAIVDRLPWAGLVIGVATFVLLFLMFGSLLVPAKALVLNLLSLTATFGAMVWVFQDGHGSGLLDFTATGTLDTTTPILMFCIAFGLSMDYEVFLLARIKEERDRGAGNTAAVAMGLERTGRIVTAAAALLAVTFLAFGTSGVSFIKLFGLGLALAVVIDASVVRATLVPAFIRRAGEANSWAPRPRRRIHERFGLHEHVDLDDEAELPVAPAPVDGERDVRQPVGAG
ncbi:MAG: MMPL family transporter [Acidimicrobiia bacterium]